MMEKQWHFLEDDSSFERKEEVDAIVASIKERLGWRLGGVGGTSWEETTLTKMFNEYDTNSSGFLSVDEL